MVQALSPQRPNNPAPAREAPKDPPPARAEAPVVSTSAAPKPTTATSTEARDRHAADPRAAHLQHNLQRQGEHGPGEVATHLAHGAHKAHLAAEGAEAISHSVHHATEYAKHYAAAKALAGGHSQMAYDLRKMQQGLTKLENAAKNGGGPQAAAKLAEAKKAYDGAKAAYDAERPAVAAANAFLKEHALAGEAAKHGKTLKIGEAAARFEHALASSRIGKGLLTTGRIVANPAMVRGLQVFGGLVEGFAGYVDSNNKTTGGKLANGALAGGGGALVMANPWVAGADMLAPEGYKLSEVYRGGAGAVSSIAEGMITGDTRGMDEFHGRSKRGDYGVVMKQASEAGDYWAQHGIGGGLALGWENLKWWVSGK